MLNAKVVWWTEGTDGNPKRYVLGKREPVAAWRLFMGLRGRGHVVAGPDLWIGKKLVLHYDPTAKPPVQLGRA